MATKEGYRYKTEKNHNDCYPFDRDNGQEEEEKRLRSREKEWVSTSAKGKEMKFGREPDPRHGATPFVHSQKQRQGLADTTRTPSTAGCLFQPACTNTYSEYRTAVPPCLLYKYRAFPEKMMPALRLAVRLAASKVTRKKVL